MRQDASYFRVYHDYIRPLKLSLEQAAVLSDMINTAGMKKAEQNDGWFDYKVEWMKERLGIEPKAQQRVINKLKEAGWIEAAKAGNPARRRVRINIEDIENTIEQYFSKVETDPTRAVETDPTRAVETDPTPCIKQETTKATRRRSMKKEKGALIPAENTSSTKDEWSIRCAERLRDIVINKMFRLRSYSPTSWAKKFARLRASLGGEQNFTEKHIEAVLEWYSENWEEVKAKPACASSWCREDLFNLMSDKMEQAGLINNPKGVPGQSHTQRQKGVGCSNKRLTIPDDVREELDGIEWAKGEPAGLDQFYLETLDAADRLITVGRGVDEDGEEGAALDNFIYAMGGSPKPMALRWCRWAAASANAWKGWGGSLKPFRLHPDSNLFKDRLKATCGSVQSGTVGRLIATLKQQWP
jgi:DNA-binding MarR family transcriptional regulator